MTNVTELPNTMTKATKLRRIRTNVIKLPDAINTTQRHSILNLGAVHIWPSILTAFVCSHPTSPNKTNEAVRLASELVSCHFLSSSLLRLVTQSCSHVVVISRLLSPGSDSPSAHACTYNKVVLSNEASPAQNELLACCFGTHISLVS